MNTGNIYYMVKRKPNKRLNNYQDKLMDMTKNTMKLGVATSVGGAIIGGAPAPKGAKSAVMGALTLSAVGNTAYVGMNILPGQDEYKNKKKSKLMKKFY